MNAFSSMSDRFAILQAGMPALPARKLPSLRRRGGTGILRDGVVLCFCNFLFTPPIPRRFRNPCNNGFAGFLVGRRVVSEPPAVARGLIDIYTFLMLDTILLKAHQRLLRRA
jgi:hypothetical protein